VVGRSHRERREGGEEKRSVTLWEATCGWGGDRSLFAKGRKEERVEAAKKIQKPSFPVLGQNCLKKKAGVQTTHEGKNRDHNLIG